MAKKTINLGVTPDGEGGDNLRSAFTKTNENFSELYRDKVSAEAGKQLSDENYTLAEKEKLSGVADEATKNRADSENADKVHSHAIGQVDGLSDALLTKFDKTDVVQTTGQSTTEIMSQKAVTDIFLQYNDYQTGLRWNQETDIYQVLGSSHRTRIQERMRRCVLNDDGTVNYYLDQHDSTKKEDGTPAILNGTDGNVMVEIPKFYYKQSLVGDQHEWWISATPAAGYEVHEAFLKNGDTEVDYVYWAAYRPTTLDDKLMSVSDVAPTVSKNITTFRAEARANGEGWNLPNYHILNAIRLLYLLEYCTFNSQAVLGNGNHTGANYTRTTGVSNILGNESSSPAITGWMSYRGIEDFYASSWQFIDGCGLNDGVFRSTNVEADYNNTLTGDSYVSGASVPEFSATYIKKITSDFLPQLGVGSSTTFTCDGAWSNPSSLRVLRFGGRANSGAIGGVFCADLNGSFSNVAGYLAAGLSFR